jgi:hypothetical protein
MKTRLAQFADIVARTMLLVLVTGTLGAQESRLTISEHGVGTEVVDRELRGKAESFPEGTRVFFWTRVLGGEEGDRIHHVWIKNGKELKIGLNVGGSHWRTHSIKTLHEGSAGDWVVEARDYEGNVLAHQAFVCTPLGS